MTTHDDQLPPRPPRRRRRKPIILTDFGGNNASLARPKKVKASTSNAVFLECVENCRKPWPETILVLTRASAPRCPSCGALAFETDSSSRFRSRTYDRKERESAEQRKESLPYKCPRCPLRFRSQAALRLHGTEKRHFASEIS